MGLKSNLMSQSFDSNFTVVYLRKTTMNSAETFTFF